MILMRVGRSGAPSAAHNRANKVRVLAPQPLIEVCHPVTACVPKDGEEKPFGELASHMADDVL